jgi:CBS domain-containing protein
VAALAMRVHEVMTQPVITTRPDMSVADARALMEKERIRHLPVTGEDEELLGIVTDRDIRRSLPSPVSSLSVWEMNHLLAKLTLEEVMTTAVITIRPHRDAREAARIMVDHKIGALPVTEVGHLVGIVTETDLLRAFAAGA